MSQQHINRFILPDDDLWIGWKLAELYFWNLLSFNKMIFIAVLYFIYSKIKLCVALKRPRSSVTDSVYDSKRSYTTPYSTVYILYTLRIRPYFAGFRVTVFRSYMSVTVYDEIRRSTETVYGAYLPCIRSHTERIWQ
jgi:hypothetical protein